LAKKTMQVILCKDCRFFRAENHREPFLGYVTKYYCNSGGDEYDDSRTRGPEWYCADAEEADPLTDGVYDPTWVERMASDRPKGTHYLESFSTEEINIAFEKLKPDFWKTYAREDPETLRKIYGLEFDYV